MEIRVPQTIIYETDQVVPVADVVAALLGAEQIFRDVGPLLECFFPNLKVDGVRVSVKEISQNSPLREILYATLFLTYQDDLQKDVPAIIHQTTGLDVSDHYTKLVTIVFCLLLFYGIDFIHSQVSKAAFSKRIRSHLDEFAKDLSAESGISEERIHKLITEKFGKSRARVIAYAALRVFQPSKRQNNAPVMLGRTRIERETVAEIPSDAQIESANVTEITQHLQDVQIELHAQDVDRAKQGWAAIIPKVSSKRLRLELYPPIKPEELYTKTKIRGDVMVVLSRKSDGTYKPSMAHLLNVRG
jgi:hypothetical protein